MKGLRALLLLAPSLFALPANGHDVAGRWCGEGEQSGPGDFQARWSAILVLDGATGRMDYPSLNCGGTLSLEAVNGTVHVYRERIDYGHERCLDDGLINIEFLHGSAHWVWTGSGAVARALLTPQCRLLS